MKGIIDVACWHIAQIKYITELGMLMPWFYLHRICSESHFCKYSWKYSCVCSYIRKKNNNMASFFFLNFTGLI